MAIRYNALTEPIDPIRLQVFSQQSMVKNWAIKYYGLFGALLAGVFGATFILSFFSLTALALGLNNAINTGVTVLGVVGLTALGYFIGRSMSQRTIERMYRLSNFAEANGLAYNYRFDNPGHAGMIFNDGYDRYAKDQLYSTSGDLFEIGDYYFTTGSGKSRQTHSWGYACIKLKRKVPNMVLDAKANNVHLFGMNISNLPESLRGNSTLSLEGDFDNYFTLYAPKEYERDALYIFTPDLMAQLIDDSAQFDVEVVDDRMYIYSSVAFDVAQPATLQKIFAIINQVGEEMIEQTDYYADERVGDRQANIVAAPGRRLKHNVPVLLIVIIIVIFMGSQFFPFIWAFINMLIHQ